MKKNLFVLKHSLLTCFRRNIGMRLTGVALSLMLAVLLSACGRYGYAAETTLPYSSNESFASMPIELEPEVANTQKPTSNPFAAALLEYFAGGVDSHEQISRKAFWADITYSGNQGVVAIRQVPLNEPWYIDGILQPTSVLTQARIFYFTANQLIYKDVEDFREASVAITPSGRVILNSTRDVGDWRFTVLGGATDLVNHIDMLIYQFTVYREFQENGSYNYYIFRGGWSEGLEGGRTPITEEEFNTINTEYGLTDWIGWGLMRDETEQILEFSNNCQRESSDTITPPPEPERNQYSDEWTTITAGLNGGISISIPNTWLSYEHIPNPGEEPFRGLTISSEALNGLTISIWESPISHPSMIVEEFPYSEQFQFDDGFIGYMLKNEKMLLWLHSGDESFGILSIYLHHYEDIFTDNEDLILRIVRSLRNNFLTY